MKFDNIKPLPSKELCFVWGWCETCDAPYIKCPKCGNNCCNGGYGEINGVVCDTCNLAYQYQQLAGKTNTEPKKEEIK